MGKLSFLIEYLEYLKEQKKIIRTVLLLSLCSVGLPIILQRIKIFKKRKDENHKTGCENDTYSGQNDLKSPVHGSEIAKAVEVLNEDTILNDLSDPHWLLHGLNPVSAITATLQFQNGREGSDESDSDELDSEMTEISTGDNSEMKEMAAGDNREMKEMPSAISESSSIEGSVEGLSYSLQATVLESTEESSELGSKERVLDSSKDAKAPHEELPSATIDTTPKLIPSPTDKKKFYYTDANGHVTVFRRVSDDEYLEEDKSLGDKGKKPASSIHVYKKGGSKSTKSENVSFGNEPNIKPNPEKTGTGVADIEGKFPEITKYLQAKGKPTQKLNEQSVALNSSNPLQSFAIFNRPVVDIIAESFSNTSQGYDSNLNPNAGILVENTSSDGSITSLSSSNNSNSDASLIEDILIFSHYEHLKEKLIAKNKTICSKEPEPRKRSLSPMDDSYKKPKVEPMEESPISTDSLEDATTMSVSPLQSFKFFYEQSSLKTTDSTSNVAPSVLPGDSQLNPTEMDIKTVTYDTSSISGSSSGHISSNVPKECDLNQQDCTDEASTGEIDTATSEDMNKSCIPLTSGTESSRQTEIELVQIQPEVNLPNPGIATGMEESSMEVAEIHHESIPHVVIPQIVIEDIESYSDTEEE